MRLPEKVNASWIATLADKELLEAEAMLHKQFVTEETAEKHRAGSRYEMLRGPQSLVSAWLRWLLVNNETHARGVLIARRSEKSLSRRTS